LNYSPKIACPSIIPQDRQYVNRFFPNYK